jgi:hypothetical protein
VLLLQQLYSFVCGEHDATQLHGIGSRPSTVQLLMCRVQLHCSSMYDTSYTQPLQSCHNLTSP